ncbi:MAG: hypothetical protein HYY49_03350 [Ignavibacteriales bacterium]|nr:hypothetical protein [Ignavibacteriales bacterium]
MSPLPEIQIKFLSSSEFIRELETDFRKVGEEVKVISSGPEKDPTELDFGLNEVAAIVTIIQGSFYLGELAFKLFSALKASREKTVVVQTPFHRAEIHAHNDLTQEEVQRILKSIIELGQ